MLSKLAFRNVKQVQKIMSFYLITGNIAFLLFYLT